MDRELLTLREAATLLGLSPATLREQVRRGRLATIRPGHDRLVTSAEVERYRTMVRRAARGGN